MKSQNKVCLHLLCGLVGLGKTGSTSLLASRSWPARKYKAPLPLDLGKRGRCGFGAKSLFELVLAE